MVSQYAGDIAIALIVENSVWINIEATAPPLADSNSCKFFCHTCIVLLVLQVAMSD